MKKFLKGILLYATIVYFCCFITIVESLSIIALIIGISLFILLSVACYIILNEDNLENYIPKWFR